MMSFIFDPFGDRYGGWFVAAFFATGIWLLIVLCIGVAIKDAKTTANSYTGRQTFPTKAQVLRPTLIWAAVLWVILYAAGNGLVWWSSSTSADQNPGVSTTEYARTFGFENGKEYPLLVGSRIAGSSGSLDFESGLFYANASGSFTPSSALSIGFEQGGKSYILELLTSKITFVQDESAEPNISMRLTDATVDDAYYTQTYSPCKLVIDSLWWTCEKTVVSNVMTVYPSSQRQGLSPVVAKYFESATITLDKKAYDAILQKG